ncbi:hypothetical protein ACFQE1_18725, partial [Halobium palmae]
IGSALPVPRRPVVAGLAALVGAGGRVVLDRIGDLLRTLARSGSSGTLSVSFSGPQVWSVGIPPARLPVEWLFEASFLLAVLFVTGPRIEPRDLLKGVVVIFGVQSTVTLLPALVPPSRPVDLWAVSGPVLTPFGDLTLFFALAVAVWLAFHGGLETLQRLPPSRSVHESE